MKRALVLVLLAASATARADDRPTAATAVSSAKVVAVIAGVDAMHATLVGPSGQIYEPDGKGAWARHAAGGVAADVTGAVRLGDTIEVTGRSTPLYKDDAGTWFTVELGSDGHTVMGTGPTAALAVNRDVFVSKKGKWTRVASLPGKVDALWADDKVAYAATDADLYRIRGKDAAKAGTAPHALAGGTAWALDGGLTQLAGGKTVPATLAGAAVTIVAAGGAAGDANLTVVADSGGKLVLAHTQKGALAKIDDVPASGTVVGLAVDKVGGVLIAFADGTIAVRSGGAWTSAQVSDALPAAKAGAGPAQSR